MVSQQVYLITGASRGIALHLTALLVQQNPSATVFAGARETSALEKNLKALNLTEEQISRVYPVTLDVTKDDDIAAARKHVGEKLAALGLPGINYLINSAGVSGSGGSFKQQSRQELLDVFNTNTAGVIAVTQAFSDLVEAAEAAHKGSSKVFLVSTILASHGVLDESSPTRPHFKSDVGVSYRASKYALTGVARFSLQPYFNAKGIPVFVLHPGWVQTDMGNAFGPAPVTIQDSVTGIAKLLANAKYEDQEKFLVFDGTTLPW